jgi:hypothetical protein
VAAESRPLVWLFELLAIPNRIYQSLGRVECSAAVNKKGAPQFDLVVARILNVL